MRTRSQQPYHHRLGMRNKCQVLGSKVLSRGGFVRSCRIVHRKTLCCERVQSAIIFHVGMLKVLLPYTVTSRIASFFFLQEIAMSTRSLGAGGFDHDSQLVIYREEFVEQAFLVHCMPGTLYLSAHSPYRPALRVLAAAIRSFSSMQYTKSSGS
jgi:hypothetical protein